MSKKKLSSLELKLKKMACLITDKFATKAEINNAVTLATDAQIDALFEDE